MIASTICVVPVKAGENTVDDIKGNLVIVGGALETSNANVYNEFIKLSSGSGNTKIGIIPAASSKPSKYGNAFKNDLMRYGVKEENIELIPIAVINDKTTENIDESTWIENVNKDEIVKLIESCTGIWFVGGDQERLTNALYNEDGSSTKALDAVWKIYKNGSVLGGTSAGAAVMSDVMLAGGASYGTLSKGFTDVFEDESDQEAGPSYLERGLGFFKYGIIDQHFDGKARLGRLIVTAFEKGQEGQCAYGVDEDTAMVFNNDDMTIEVIGRAGVTVVDLSQAVKNNTIRTSLQNVEISLIKPGDKYNIKTKEFTINSDKFETTNGNEYNEYKPSVISGVFSEHGLWKDAVSYALVDNYENNEIVSYSFDESGNGFKILFKENGSTKGYWNYTDGNKDDYSFINVYVDIIPVKVDIVNNGIELKRNPEYTVYVVKSGDCLISIAKKFNVNYIDIAEDNEISNIRLILPGQQLKIYN